MKRHVYLANPLAVNFDRYLQQLEDAVELYKWSVFVDSIKIAENEGNLGRNVWEMRRNPTETMLTMQECVYSPLRLQLLV